MLPGNPTCSASRIVYKAQMSRACVQVLTKDQIESCVLVPVPCFAGSSKTKEERQFIP